jgi:hypothetical protein
MVERTVVRSEARCAGLLLLLLALAGCSFDTAPISLRSGVQAPHPPNGDGAAPQAGAPGASGSGSVEVDSGTPPANTPPPVDEPVQPDASSSDAAAPTPVTDAAGAPPADAGIDAAVDTGTAPEDASVPGEGLFDPCDTGADCSAGLVCYGSGFGYCAQPCAESSECVDVDGVDFTCSPNDNACRVNCAEDGTDGICPKGLTCVEFASEGRCLPPGVGGTSPRALFEPCDVANGDDDCADGLSCYRAADSRVDGPGYCTLSCMGRGADCDDLDSSPAVLACEEDTCRFDCTDAPCPEGMTCETMGRRNVCHYPSS